MALLFGTSVCLPVLPSREHRPLSRIMSSTGLTSEAQLRYLLQWFEEFSELQREDFLPILAAARSGEPEQLAASIATLSCQDKPVSLFQCRIKLFNEWYPTWAEEERDRLLKGVTEIDEDFGNKIQELLTNGTQPNGDVNGDNTNYGEETNEIDQLVADNTDPQEHSVEITAAS